MPSGCLGAGRGIRVSRVCRWLGGLQISFRADAVGMRSGKDFRGALSLPRECHQQVVEHTAQQRDRELEQKQGQRWYNWCICGSNRPPACRDELPETNSTSICLSGQDRVVLALFAPGLPRGLHRARARLRRGQARPSDFLILSP